MIHITEVGPRDGLQNEKVILTTEEKLTFIHHLIDSGAKSIEVASFVNSNSDIYSISDLKEKTVSVQKSSTGATSLRKNEISLL